MNGPSAPWLLLASGCGRPPASLPVEAPAPCRAACPTPFGEQLGVADGVPARSKCSADCVDPTPVYAAPADTHISEPDAIDGWHRLRGP